MNRRELLKTTVAASAALATVKTSTVLAASDKKTEHNFTYCLNTSTIREQNLGLMGEIDVAAAAGFDGIEIWMQTLQAYLGNGGKLSDVKSKADDLGLVIEDSIGFAAWMVDDDDTRNKAVEQIKQEMSLLAEIGCKRIAAPPMGATSAPSVDLLKVAQRYKVLCDLGEEMGVLPQLELWGFSHNLHLLGETLFVAAESGHSSALILPDVFHIQRGGSPFEALEMINGSKMQMFHINDYPANVERENLTDDMRVMPGDGVAPLNNILQILNNKGTPIVLSLEIFNEDIWQLDALEACKLGVSKMKAAVDRAIDSALDSALV